MTKRILIHYTAFMLIIPAIDIISGCCVRLLQGDYDKKTVYSRDPASVAKTFAEAGASRLHVVDLDAARGDGNNRKTITAIRTAFPGLLEVGGGVRSPKDIESLLKIGVDRLIIGTALVQCPKEVSEWAKRYGPVFIAGIDACDSAVKISGWVEGSTLNAVHLAADVKLMGMTEIIYTDITRDGTMHGPNLEQTTEIVKASGLPVIISGGIAGMDDIKQLAMAPIQGVAGVIIGKALYEGRIKLAEAVRLLKGGSE